MTADTIRVLVIEDNPGDVELLEQALSERGDCSFRIELADRLSAGLERLDRGGVDLVLLDLSLPDSQSLDTLDRVLRHAPTVPVVILTGLEEEAVALEAVRKGAQDYLTKGDLTPRDIRRALRHSHERFRAAQALQRHTVQLRMLTERLPAILWTTDRNLRITSSFGAGLRQLGLDSGQLVGTRLQDYLQTSDPDSIPLAAHLEALEGKQVSYDYKWRGRVFQTRIEPLRRGEHVVGTIGVAIDVTDERQLQTELQMARQIQEGLLPRSMPDLRPFEIGGITRPAEATGGDLFDFIPLADGSLAVAIGDASGHGFGPALLAAAVHACLHSLALAGVPFAIDHVLATSNRLLCLDPRRESFVTLLLGRLDPGTPALTYGSAGHPPGVVLNASDSVKAWLRGGGPPLGVEPHVAYTVGPTIPLEAGDTVLLVTDGVLGTAPTGFVLGMDRVLEVYQQNRQRSAQEIAAAICHAAGAGVEAGDLRDDLTAVVIRVKPAS